MVFWFRVLFYSDFFLHSVHLSPEVLMSESKRRMEEDKEKEKGKGVGVGVGVGVGEGEAGLLLLGWWYVAL